MYYNLILFLNSCCQGDLFQVLEYETSRKKLYTVSNLWYTGIWPMSLFINKIGIFCLLRSTSIRISTMRKKVAEFHGGQLYNV